MNFGKNATNVILLVCVVPHIREMHREVPCGIDEERDDPRTSKIWKTSLRKFNCLILCSIAHFNVGVRKYGKSEKGSKRLPMQRRKHRIKSDVGTVPLSLHTLGNGGKGTK